MMNVMGIVLFFMGLAMLAAVPLVIVLQAMERRKSVKDVTPRDPV